MLGLDAAGKSTITYRLKLGEVHNTAPTIGFNVEEVTFKNIHFTIWDIGGQTSIRLLWKYYYPNTDAIVFVVDTADTNRLQEARDTLFQLLSEEDLKDA